MPLQLLKPTALPGLAVRHRKYLGKLLKALTTTAENSFLPAIHAQEMAFVVEGETDNAPPHVSPRFDVNKVRWENIRW